MTYWRMQLHPSESGEAVRHTVESLAAGYIGLDFATDVGDLLTVDRGSLPDGQREYWAFAHEMDIGDWALVFTHHYPFALARVASQYNYIRRASPEICVWFRHFREVDEVLYYADFVTNANTWERIPMTATITPLRESTSQSHQLIQRWLAASAPQ